MNAPPHITVWLTNPEIGCFAFSDANRAHLEQRLPHAIVAVCRDEAELTAALPQTDIALVWRFRQEWFPLSPRLRWIATPAAGRDYFHVQPPAEVRLTYGTFHGELMGETVLAMMLGTLRGVVATAAARATDAWPRVPLSRQMRTLRGAHLVILGFGHIGNWVGRLAKPFGVRITGIRRTAGQPPDYFGAADRVVSAGELDRVLPEAEHLVLCLPRSDETDNILDARRIALLAPHAVVYNIGRGNAVDETALARALREGRLAAACLDVYQTEPLPADSPLRDCPNALLMPHASAFAPNYLDSFLDEFVQCYHCMRVTLQRTRTTTRTIGSPERHRHSKSRWGGPP